MDLRHLRYFVAVAEEKQFGRAARRLNIVQPALSMQIRALEEELGGLLFIRTSRNVDLTEAGKLLLVEAERVLELAQRAKSVVQSSLRGEIGIVRIGFVGNAVLTGTMTTDLQAFRKQHASAVVELHELAPRAQSTALLEGTIDVGYAARAGFKLSPFLSIARVVSAPVVVVMSSDHLLASVEKISIKLLEKECFILFGSESGDEGPLSVLRGCGLTPAAIKSAPTTLGVLALVASGSGVALAPATVATLPIPGLVYKQINDISATGDLALIHRSNETAGAVKAYIKLASNTDAAQENVCSIIK